MIATCLLAVTSGLLLCFLIRSRKAKLRTFEAMGIDGPQPNILFGNLHEWAIKKSFIAYSDWTKRYGSTYGMYEGSSPVLVTSDVDILRDIFIKKFSNFHGRRLFPVQPEPDTGADKDVHVLFSRGLRWKRLRTTISPSFSTGKIKQMLPLINSCIDQLMTVIDERCQSGDAFDIHRLIQAMTMNVIASCAFGIQPSFQENDADPVLLRCRRLFDDFARKPWLMVLGAIFPECRSFWWKACKLVSAYTYDDMEWLFNNIGDVIESRRRAAGCGDQRRRADLLQALLDAEVAAPPGGDGCTGGRRAATAAGLESTSCCDAATAADALDDGLCGWPSASSSPAASGRSIAGSCEPSVAVTATAAASDRRENRKRLSLDEVKANSVVFLVGGYETSSNIIAYAAYELATHVDCQRRLQLELDERLSSQDDFNYENVTQLEYLEMVVKETLRLYPVGSLMTGRRCMETTVVGGGIRIPEGMTVQPDVWSLHRDPKYWGELADDFNPDRFLPEAVAARDPMVYMPFGAGPKNCMGMRFALAECKFAIARLLSKYDLHPTDETNVELCDGAALNPKHGVTLKVSQRTRASPSNSPPPSP